MLDDYILKQLENIFKAYKEVDKVLLFGSRARGDYKYNSDVDLCLFGDNITHAILANIHMDMDDIDTLLYFDVLNFNEIKNQELIDNILREGVSIYGKKA